MENRGSSKNSLIWIHCFKCLEIFIQKQRQFFLMECRHILCGSCMKKLNEKKAVCPICAKSIGFMMIGNSMPKPFRMLFHHNPSQIKNCDWKIVSFQNDTRKHFSMGLLKMVSFSTLLFPLTQRF